jgi:hypothetical protein
MEAVSPFDPIVMAGEYHGVAARAVAAISPNG